MKHLMNCGLQIADCGFKAPAWGSRPTLPLPNRQLAIGNRQFL
jgi:hypothetical protein